MKGLKVSRDNAVVMAAFVLSLLALGQLAIDLYLPSLPSMAVELRSSGTSMQQSVTTYMIAYAISPLVIGPLSDQFGRRPILLLALATYIAGALGGALSQNVGWLLGMRVVNGVGGGGLSVFSRAIMRDVFEGTRLRKIASYQVINWAFVPLVAPVVGGYIQEGLGWRFNFLGIALLGSIVWVCIFLFCPETKERSHRQTFRISVLARNYRTLLTNPLFLGYVGAIFLLYGSFIAYDVASPFLLQSQLGLGPVGYGWAMLVVGVSLMIGAFLSSRVAHRVPIHRLLWGGLSLALVGALLMLTLGLLGIFSVAALIGPACLLTFSVGLVWPNSTAGCLQHFPKLAGSASALIGSCASSGGAVISLVIAHLPEQTQVPLAGVEVVLILLSMVCLGSLALPIEARDYRARKSKRSSSRSLPS